MQAANHRASHDVRRTSKAVPMPHAFAAKSFGFPALVAAWLEIHVGSQRDPATNGRRKCSAAHQDRTGRHASLQVIAVSRRWLVTRRAVRIPNAALAGWRHVSRRNSVRRGLPLVIPVSFLDPWATIRKARETPISATAMTTHEDHVAHLTDRIAEEYGSTGWPACFRSQNSGCAIAPSGNRWRRGRCG